MNMIWASGEQGELFKKLYCEGKREREVGNWRGVWVLGRFYLRYYSIY